MLFERIHLLKVVISQNKIGNHEFSESDDGQSLSEEETTIDSSIQGLQSVSKYGILYYPTV